MAQGERRAKAVLAAAIEWLESAKGDANEASAANTKLAEAVEKYQVVMSAKLPPDPMADPMAWHCPHCGAERPAFGWHYNLGDTGPFALQWVTCFCGECKTALSVTVVAFMPKAELAEQLKKQFSTKLLI